MLPTFFTTIILVLVSIQVNAIHGQPRHRRSRLPRSPVERYADEELQARHPHQLQARAVSGWDYVGCVTDGPARALTGYSTTDSANTVDKCIQTCAGRGFNYAGMQYGNQCSCGNELSNGLGLTQPESACSYSCSGDKTAKCGAYYKLSLYKRAAPAALGCYQDQSARTLTGPSTTDSKMSTDVCAAFCSAAGYAYFGTQYGTQCFCSATAPSASKKIADSKCGTRCAINDGTTCGGYWTLSVWSILGGVGTPSAAPSAAPSPSSTTSVRPSSTTSVRPSSTTTALPSPTAAPLPLGATALGCFVDSGSPRLLVGTMQTTNKNSLDTCISFCAGAGYRYSGVEFGNQCWCGNSYDAKKTASDSACKYTCPGDSKQICGGYGVMNLFQVPLAAVSTTSSTPATPTSGCNAACTSAVGVAAPASGGGVKSLWAHHMVGNTYSYTPATWSDDISLASSAGFDGFALNHGSSDWQFDRMQDAYSVADAQGSFKLFLSIDVTAIGCGSINDAQTISSLILRYANHSSQAVYQNKTLVSTFAGDNCNFGQGNTAAGWTYVRSLVRAGGKEMYLIPAIFVDTNQFSSMTWFDGLFNWDSAWPVGGAGSKPLTTASDETWLSRVGSRGYMASISPLFFTYYGPSSWNKVWIYRSDDWLIARRFEQLASMRNKIDMAEFVTWNDYGESHYVGPIRADQPNSQGWVDGYPHTAWLSLIRYYGQGFKYGSYPAITSDQIWLWTRPHPKAANPSAPTVRRPDNWDTTEDNLYVLLLLSSAAKVTINSGNNIGVWSLSAGVNKLSIASAAGAIGAKVERGGKTVKSFDSTGQFSYTTTPVDFNFNYWVASA